MNKRNMWGRRFVTVAAIMTLLAFYPGAAIVSAEDASVPESETGSTATSPAPSDTTNTPAPSTDTTTPAPTPPSNTTPVPSQPAPTQNTNTQGPKKPNGSAANTYTYNPATGLWENEYYTWNPSTHQTTPKTSQTYSYNPATNKWDTTEWTYDAPNGKYVPNTVSTDIPPAAALDTLQTVGNNPSTSNAGTTYNNFYNASISNNIGSQATTGNALANGNTNVGNILTGNANAVANIINLLQSAATFGNGDLALFSKNIMGDVVGDLLIDPNQLAQLKASDAATSSNNLAVHNQGSGAIDNDISLNATSGNAGADGNTNVGNLTTGNANAVANIVNVINSAIAANQSFLGAVNIYGNLDGDILLPAGFLDSLIASNAQQAESPATSSNAQINTASTEAINNTIHATATTGNALADTNSTVGAITSGNALNNLTVLNMTGNDVVAANDLLVFVNVLGKWYGVIMNAPEGTTAASVAGGVKSNTLAGLAQNTDINSTTNNQINNTINLAAVTGDATATNNTRVGDITTGNATTSVNLVNFINSHLSLSDWFGILFINVFGSWTGSFGVNTAAGNPTSTPTSSTSSPNSTPTVQVFKFVPRTSDNSTERYVLAPVEGTASTPSDSHNNSITTATLGNHTNTPKPTLANSPASTTNHWIIPVLGLFAGAILLGIERFLSARDGKRSGTTITPAAA